MMCLEDMWLLLTEEFILTLLITPVIKFSVMPYTNRVILRLGTVF